MNIVKKILGLLLGMAFGAAIGYFGVMLVMWLADGGVQTLDSHSEEGIDYGLLALSIGLAFLWLFVAVIIHLILHEAGHLVMGLLTGYRFVSFRAFKLTLAKTEGGYRWKRFHIAGTGGQCIMELPEDQDVNTVPWFWYNAGGVLMNLLLIAISIIVLRTCETGIVSMSFLMMMAFVGLFLAITNGIPMTVGGVGNDGYNLWLLWRHPEQRRFFLRMLQAAGAQSRGLRLSVMPKEWFEDIPVTTASSYFEISNRALYMQLQEDRLQLDDARMVAEELMSLGKKLPQIFRLEIGSERMMLELLTLNREAIIEELWDKQLFRYTMLNSKYQPIKAAVLFTYELLHNRDAENAESYRQQVLQHRNDYTMPGEADTALCLMERAKELEGQKL